MTNEQMIEKCAQAAYHATMTMRAGEPRPYDPWEKLPEYWRRIYRVQARATIDALVAMTGGEDHIVKVTEDGWVLKHPLTERLNGDLFDCNLAAVIETLEGPPPEHGPGEYRITLEGNPGSTLVWIDWTAIS